MVIAIGFVTLYTLQELDASLQHRITYHLQSAIVHPLHSTQLSGRSIVPQHRSSRARSCTQRRLWRFPGQTGISTSVFFYALPAMDSESSRLVAKWPIMMIFPRSYSWAWTKNGRTIHRGLHGHVDIWDSESISGLFFVRKPCRASMETSSLHCDRLSWAFCGT